jgi:glycosyltransferase involved in cell wall biosynthesis
MVPRGFQQPKQSVGHATKDPTRVVVVNRLLDYKRVDLVIRAWPAVLRDMPGAMLHLIGDGPQRASLEELAATVGVATRVRFHGSYPEREPVLEGIATASLLLQPSVREGQSTVVLEAMSLGTAVLAAEGPETAVADFLGQVTDANTALLPQEAGPEQWAARIVMLLRDESLRQRLETDGRRVAGRLRWREAIAPQVESLYLSLRSLAVGRLASAAHPSRVG